MQDCRIEMLQVEMDVILLLADAAAFADSADIGTIMDRVRAFLFEKNLLGPNAASADAVGIELAGGKLLGDPKNVKFRFTDAYMAMAAAGKL